MHENSVEFEVSGDYALFSDPITRVGGEKLTYPTPTYGQIKGMLDNTYHVPTIIWVIDKVRIMNMIQTETRGVRPLKWDTGGNALSYYTYLKKVKYQVKAHFIWNENIPELECDRNENKHHNIAKRMIERGGRRDVFLGTRECQGYVTPCVYGEGKGAYDDIPEVNFGIMVHGITYPEEAYSDQTKGKLTVRLWNPVMRYGEIEFCHQTDFSLPMKDVLSEVYGSCIQKPIRDMQMKRFSKQLNNFSGHNKFEGGDKSVVD